MGAAGAIRDRRPPIPAYSQINPTPRLAAAKPLKDLQGNPLGLDPMSYGMTELPWT